ncbi:hypothetical protein MD484_g5182, partial [Candolleomyces efflorescens]
MLLDDPNGALTSQSEQFGPEKRVNRGIRGIRPAMTSPLVDCQPIRRFWFDLVVSEFQVSLYPLLSPTLGRCRSMALHEPAWRIPSRPCPFYQKGNCIFATRCNFLHVAPEKGAVEARAARFQHVSQDSTDSIYSSPAKPPIVRVESPVTVRSPPREPQIQRLLSALTDVIGDEPEEDEDEDEHLDVEPYNESVTLIVEPESATWSAGLPTLVHDGDSTFFARVTDTMAEMMRLTDGEGSDDEFDSKPVRLSLKSANDPEEPLSPGPAQEASPEDDDDNNTLKLPPSSHPSVNDSVDTPSIHTTHSTPDAQYIEMPAIPDNHNDLLSPVDLSHLQLTSFHQLLDDQPADASMINKGPSSIDSVVEESWKSPPVSAKSPPRSPNRSSTFELLRSPFGSPSARVLSPRLGAFGIGRSPSSMSQLRALPSGGGEQLEPPDLADDLDSPSDRIVAAPAPAANDDVPEDLPLQQSELATVRPGFQLLLDPEPQPEVELPLLAYEDPDVSISTGSEGTFGAYGDVEEEEVVVSPQEQRLVEEEEEPSFGHSPAQQTYEDDHDSSLISEPEDEESFGHTPAQDPDKNDDPSFKLEDLPHDPTPTWQQIEDDHVLEREEIGQESFGHPPVQETEDHRNFEPQQPHDRTPVWHQEEKQEGNSFGHPPVQETEDDDDIFESEEHDDCTPVWQQVADNQMLEPEEEEEAYDYTSLSQPVEEGHVLERERQVEEQEEELNSPTPAWQQAEDHVQEEESYGHTSVWEPAGVDTALFVGTPRGLVHSEGALERQDEVLEEEEEEDDEDPSWHESEIQNSIDDTLSSDELSTAIQNAIELPLDNMESPEWVNQEFSQDVDVPPAETVVADASFSSVSQTPQPQPLPVFSPQPAASLPPPLTLANENVDENVEVEDAFDSPITPDNEDDSTAFLAYLQREPELQDGDTINSLYDSYTDMAPSPKSVVSFTESPMSNASGPLPLRERVFTPPPPSSSRLGHLYANSNASSPITSLESVAKGAESPASVASSSKLSLQGTDGRQSRDMSRKIPFGFRNSQSQGHSARPSLVINPSTNRSLSRLSLSQSAGLEDPVERPISTPPSSSNSRRSSLRPLRLSTLLNSHSRPGHNSNLSLSNPNNCSEPAHLRLSSVSSRNSLSALRSLSSAPATANPYHSSTASSSNIIDSRPPPRSPSLLTDDLNYLATFGSPISAPVAPHPSWPSAPAHVTQFNHHHLRPSSRLSEPIYEQEEEDNTFRQDVRDEPIRRPLPLDVGPRTSIAAPAPYTPNSIPTPPHTAPPLQPNITRPASSLLREPPASIHSIATPKPTLMFAIASDDVEEVKRVLENGDANPNDAVGPQSALQFALTNDQLTNKLDIVKTLLAFGADPKQLKNQPQQQQRGAPSTSQEPEGAEALAGEGGSAEAKTQQASASSLMEGMDPATRYYVERADAAHTRKTSKLIHRSFFRPLTRVRYDLVGQDRALEELFRLLSIHSRQISVTPVVVMFSVDTGKVFLQENLDPSSMFLPTRSIW